MSFQTLFFINYLIAPGSIIPDRFLIDFERRMLKFNPATRGRIAQHEREQILLTATFLISKCLVAKVLFKPYRITEFLGIQRNSCSTEFKNNSISLGYIMIGLLTEVVYEAYY